MRFDAIKQFYYKVIDGKRTIDIITKLMSEMELFVKEFQESSEIPMFINDKNELMTIESELKKYVVVVLI